MKFHSFSREASDSLAEMEQGGHCGAGSVLPLGSVEQSGEKEKGGGGGGESKGRSG